MRIQTFSILAGSAACNARCPFCVSRMTPAQGVGRKPPEPHWRNFAKACRLAQQAGVTTAMLTGKGEPTLFPEQVTAYLEALQRWDFPFVELQTNGIPIADGDVDDALLRRWYDLGLSTVIVSIVHVEPAANRAVYLPHRAAYIDLPALVGRLHAIGFSVRLGGIALRDHLDTPETVQRLLAFAAEHRIEQCTLRPVTVPAPGTVQDRAVEDWIRAHAVDDARWTALAAWAAAHGTLLMHLVHGAAVWDIGGRNLCLSNCLTISPGDTDLRQLIFFPDGHLRYDWQYEGAILL